jgi:hypothetical protein
VSNYTFETAGFGLSDQGLHLLRSGYNYKTLANHDIRGVTLKRGVAIKNGLLILASGIALITFSVYQAIHVYNTFMDPNVHAMYIETIVLPVLPLILGNYCIYISLKRTTILQVRYKGGKIKLPLKNIVNQDQAYQLASHLQEKLGPRFRVEDHEAVSTWPSNAS